MEKVRYGIIGIGNMGVSHAQNLCGEIRGAELTAVCDTNPERLKWAKEHLPASVQLYDTPEAFWASQAMDAVLIAVPHYDHPGMAIQAFENGYHVLVEKPGRRVYESGKGNERRGGEKRQAIRHHVQSAHEPALHQTPRPHPIRRARRSPQNELDHHELVPLAKLLRFRRLARHLGGEGGGVLLNQDPHQLDLWQWTTGMMPKRVRAFCHFGKYRNIEVEDDVTAYVEYENGATGVFVTTVGESPGTNRFEISGDNGKIVIENDKLTFWRLRVPEPEFNRNYKGGFGQPECWVCDIPVVSGGGGPQHKGILQNFTNALLHGEKLLAPGEEGILGLTISNAMHLSAWTDDWVDLPLDEDLFYEKLQEKIANSTFRKDPSAAAVLDVKGTH